MNEEVKHIAIVVNPVAGSGRGLKLSEQIINILSGKNILSQQFCDVWPSAFNEFTDIWIVGGDGTLNYFINRYPHIHLPLVVFPGGSGNDFSWMLYGNKSLDQIIETALTTSPSPVDAGRCNNHLFLNGAGIGFEGAVAKGLAGKNKVKGKASFYREVIRKIITYKEQSYQLLSDQTGLYGKYLIISVMNGRRAGGGFHIAPQASLADGLLEINLVKPLSILKRLRYLPVIEKGKHSDLPFVHYCKASKIQISCDQDMNAHLDGEYFSSNYIEIESLPAKFSFRY